MNQADYLRDPWWELVDEQERSNRELQKQLERDDQEVFTEMLKQERASGKSARQVGAMYGLHMRTVMRRTNERT